MGDGLHRDRSEPKPGLNECTAMLAIDVEPDWGTSRLDGVGQVLPRLLALLERHGATATLFVVGAIAGEVARVVGAGGPHEIGSHGQTHARLDRVPAGDVRRELVASKDSLEAVGFEVLGFRAPFLAAPAHLASELLLAGYLYDASLGALVPGVSGGRHAPDREAILRVGGGTLADRVTPFNLTWLRLLHPASGLLLPRRPAFFSLHLHELLPGVGGGWTTWPAWLRRLHARRCGAPAWTALERVLERYRFESCRSHLARRGLLTPRPALAEG